MHIRKLDPSTFQPSYGVTSAKIFPSPESGATPFNAYWVFIEPGGASQIHRHHEGETFIIVQGSGMMTVGDETAPVEVGDVIFMKPLVDHTLANTSDTEQLLVLDVYWEDIKLLLAEDDEGETAQGETAQGVLTLAYPTPPTPNGNVHLGHFSGPFLSTDLFIRHRRMMGDPAYMVMGSDDNQVWTATKAKTRGETPQQTADYYANRIDQTLQRARVDCHYFFHPNATDLNRKMLDEVTTKLYNDGHLVAKDAPALWCETCDMYLFEAFVCGRCPHCDAASSGHACEECGLPNKTVDLVDAKCTQCQSTPVERNVRRLFFPLEPHRKMLEEYHWKVIMSNSHRALVSRLMEGELPDIVVSHPYDWGIPVPLEGFEGQILSAWIEMAFGYLVGTEELAQQEEIEGGWRAFWCSDDTQVVEVFGFDNCWNHAVWFPAMLKAFDAKINPPTGFLSNQLYRLDNQKFSTCRDHAVWADDILEMNSPDTVRCYAAFTCPESEETNYTLEGFASFVDNELIGNWQGWLASLQQRMDDFYEGKIPEAGMWTAPHLAFLKRLKGFLDQAAEAYSLESFSPQRVTRIACELVRAGHEFGKSEKAWATSPAAHNALRTALALEMAAVRTLAMITQPLMPDFSNHLWSCLGYSTPLKAWETEPHFVTPGQTVTGLGDEYFPTPVVAKA